MMDAIAKWHRSDRLSHETLLNAFPDPTWVKDLDGIYRFCNPAYERFFALAAGSVIGRRDADLLPEAIATAFARHEREVLLELGEHRQVLAIPATARARTRYLDIVRTPVLDESGQPTGILASARDITAHLSAADPSWDTESRFHQLFEQIEAISVQGYDRNRKVIYWNPASEVLYGYRAEEALGRQLEDLIIPDFMREGVVAAVDAWVAGGPGIPAGELTLRRADGAPVHVFSSHVILRGPDGEPQMYCVDIDLTDRKAAEDRIRKLSLAVEQSPESIVITDLQGNIEYVNEAFVRNTGYARADIIGKNPRALKSGKTPDGVYADLWETLGRGQEWRGEFTNQRRDGSHFIEMAVITPIRQPDGQITHYVAVKEDITEKKRIAEELERHRSHLEDLVEERTRQLSEARAQAEAASQAKSAFLANMSHEIRTPMNAILGLTYLLSRDLELPKQRDILAKIDHSANHLLSIINDILDISKIEAGKFSLQTRDFASDDLFAQLRSLIQGQLETKGLDFACIADPLPRMLHGDDTRLRQALLNYLSNAIKFTQAGSVTLQVSVIEETDADVLLRFEVMDTGIGIAPEGLARLFQPFAQIDHSLTRRYAGTGLGLVITRRLAQLMGGDSGAQSEAGKGSRFWLTARLGKGSLQEPVASAVTWSRRDAESQLREEFAGARILVAEDNAINQEVIRTLLDLVGLRVDLASGGHQAIAMASQDRYDLILMDVQMPELDGLEATRILRARTAWRPCPILAMTANAFEEDRRHCLDAGMDDHIPKPIDPSHLYSVLLKWLAPIPSETPAPRSSAEPSPAVAAHEPEPALARLSRLPGVDVAFGIANLNGKPEFYRRILAQYVQHHAGDVRCLRESLAAGDLEGAGHLAHTLKGVAGTLGFTHLQSLMVELQAGCRAGLAPTALEIPLASAEAAQAELLAAIGAEGCEILPP